MKNRSFNIPPGISEAFDTFAVPGKGISWSGSSGGWGIWTIESISCDIYTLHDAIYCNLSADSGSRALESHHIVEKYGVNFHGVQALDHLKYICDGAFERLFGSGKGEIWGLPWVMLKLRFDRYIMTTFLSRRTRSLLYWTSRNTHFLVLQWLLIAVLKSYCFGEV